MKTNVVCFISLIYFWKLTRQAQIDKWISRSRTTYLEASTNWCWPLDLVTLTGITAVHITAPSHQTDVLVLFSSPLHAFPCFISTCPIHLEGEVSLPFFCYVDTGRWTRAGRSLLPAEWKKPWLPWPARNSAPAKKHPLVDVAVGAAYK